MELSELLPEPEVPLLELPPELVLSELDPVPPWLVPVSVPLFRLLVELVLLMDPGVFILPLVVPVSVP